MKLSLGLIVAFGVSVPALAGSSPTVEMDEYVVARAPQTDSIRTFGVATCIALFIHNRASKIGALGHISPSTDVRRSVERMVRGMLSAGASPLDLEAQLFGGWDTRPVAQETGFNSVSPKMREEILSALNWHHVRIRREETLTVPYMTGARPYPAMRHVVMDLRTGDVSDYQPQTAYQLRSEPSVGWTGEAKLLKTHPESLDARK